MSRTMFCKSLFILFLFVAPRLASAQSLLPGDCFAAGGFCDASNTCVKDEPDVDEILQESFLGDCEVPDIIIIGPGDISGPAPVGPHVEFVNQARTMLPGEKVRPGDLVVAAKENGLPGGTKKLQVKVVPSGKMAMLTITRPLGNAGSALFDNGTKMVTVKDGDTITIKGGQTSDKPRNMAITAMIGGIKVPGEFDFTVFRIDATGFVSGFINNVLPKRVLANSGKALTIGSIPLKARTMRRLYEDVVTINSSGVPTVVKPDGKIDRRSGAIDFDRVGHKHINEIVAYGGIVLKGTIVPSNILPTDFSRKLRPGAAPQDRESFNWLRTKTTREEIHDASGAFLGQAKNTCYTNANDDSTDEDEDLIPRDGSTIWTIDAPAVIADPSFPGRGDTHDGYFVRGTYQFADWVEYSGVRVSQDVNWYWLFSHNDPPGKPAFVQDNTYPGADNTMGLAKLPITFNPCSATTR